MESLDGTMLQVGVGNLQLKFVRSSLQLIKFSLFPLDFSPAIFHTCAINFQE